ncbi:hypothetical protein DUNSADRAFT_14492 [Dunaliella salina]|uniref:C2H2-type domain-containing protein n=1 Tax=Dunaliella salina TaxID=3046 RepID=A0ABQ7H2R4_DUNSA|nr:hypothetical protein DUNSADRAFT_14492 [Dunaliella salina]|eukprot:KAF5841093.1 hypothetical protein DUNSADRAFT_14492 [Dunaliella salina]
MEEQQALALPAPQEQDGQPLSINLRTYDEAEGRFYCPFPGCTRSFAELWRLKVHYRAPPDIRGSGKERGHGTELMHCPKCGNTLKPGKHHVGCIAGKGAPRLVSKRKGSGHAENGDSMAPPKKSKKKGAAQPKLEPQQQEQEQESSSNIPMSLPLMPDMSIPSLTPSNGWGGLDMHAPQDSSVLPLGLSIPPPQFWPEFPACTAQQQQPASYSNGAQVPLPGYPWQSAPQLPGGLMMPFMLPPPVPSQGEHSTPDAVDPSWAAWAQQQQQQHQQFQHLMPQPNHDSFAQPHHQQQQQQQHLSYQQQQNPFSMQYPSQHQQHQQQHQQHQQQQPQHLSHSQPSQANSTAFMPPSATSQAAAQLMPPRLPTPADKPNPELNPASRQVTPMGASNPGGGGCTMQSMSSMPSLGSLNSDILPDPLAVMSDPSHNLQSMPHHHPQHDGGTNSAQQPGPLSHAPSSAESAPSPPGGAAARGGMLSDAGGAMGSQAADAAAAEAEQAQAMLQEVDGDLLRVPSPPPLPNDFHPGNARPIFNFGQFNQRMPASQTNFGSISNQELGDIEAMDLAELNVVYDHSDDGELMQLLFGIGGDVPSMATVHMHKGPSPPPLPQIPDEDEPSLLLNRPSPIQEQPPLRWPGALDATPQLWVWGRLRAGRLMCLHSMHKQVRPEDATCACTTCASECAE